MSNGIKKQSWKSNTDCGNARMLGKKAFQYYTWPFYSVFAPD